MVMMDRCKTCNIKYGDEVVCLTHHIAGGYCKKRNEVVQEDSRVEIKEVVLDKGNYCNCCKVEEYDDSARHFDLTLSNRPSSHGYTTRLCEKHLKEISSEISKILGG